MFESLTLSNISKRQRALLRKPTNTSPAVWQIEEDGVRAIVKDFHYNGFWYRNTIGRFLIWREEKAYRRLKNIEGIPAFYRNINGLALVLGEIEGKNIETPEAVKKLNDQFYLDLKNLIQKVHKHGLAHCDLKRAPNIMLGDDGKPYIVDWAAAISKREFRCFPFKLIYQRFLQDDLNAVTKIKLKYCPEKVSIEERDLYMKRSRAEIAIRKIKDFFKDSLKKIA